MFSHPIFLQSAEVQQWLVDRPSGERRLWNRIHPESSQAGEHPTPAGAEERTLPQVSWGGRTGWKLCGGGATGKSYQQPQKIAEKTAGLNRDKTSLWVWERAEERATSGMSKAWQGSWHTGRYLGGWMPVPVFHGPASQRCSWIISMTDFLFHQMGQLVRELEKNWVPYGARNLFPSPVSDFVHVLKIIYVLAWKHSAVIWLLGASGVWRWHSSLLSVYLLCVTAAVNPVGIPPPAWEKWCRAHSSQTPTLQVSSTENTSFYSWREFFMVCSALLLVKQSEHWSG